MRHDIFLWAANQVGMPPAFRTRLPVSGSMLYAPIPLCLGLAYMLNRDIINDDDFNTLLEQCVRDNTKKPLIDLIVAHNVQQALQKFKINISNLTYQHRRHRYRWWVTETQHKLVIAGMDNDLEDFFRTARIILMDEAEILVNLHKQKYPSGGYNEHYNPIKRTG